MKKIIALVVAIVMMAAMAVPAFAAINVQDGTGEKTASTLLTYGVNQAYVVTVPESITFSGTAATDTVSVSKGFVLPYGQSLKIAVAGLNETKWELVGDAGTNNTKLDYTVKVGDSTIAVNGTILTVAAAADSNAESITAESLASTLNFAITSTVPTYVGTYTDTLTFTASVGA